MNDVSLHNWTFFYFYFEWYYYYCRITVISMPVVQFSTMIFRFPVFLLIPFFLFGLGAWALLRILERSLSDSRQYFFYRFTSRKQQQQKSYFNKQGTIIFLMDEFFHNFTFFFAGPLFWPQYRIHNNKMMGGGSDRSNHEFPFREMFHVKRGKKLVDCNSVHVVVLVTVV